MSILFHTGICVAEYNCYKEGACLYNMKPIFLEAIGLKFPKLNIIGAHLGYAMYNVACAIAAASAYGSGNIFFDISGSDISLREIPERGYVNRDIPVSQLLWGLDEPLTRYEEVIKIWKKHFNEINLSKEEKDMIFYKNACDLLNINY